MAPVVRVVSGRKGGPASEEPVGETAQLVHGMQQQQSAGRRRLVLLLLLVDVRASSSCHSPKTLAQVAGAHSAGETHQQQGHQRQQSHQTEENQQAVDERRAGGCCSTSWRASKLGGHLLLLGARGDRVLLQEGELGVGGQLGQTGPLRQGRKRRSQRLSEVGRPNGAGEEGVRLELLLTLVLLLQVQPAAQLVALHRGRVGGRESIGEALLRLLERVCARGRGRGRGRGGQGQGLAAGRCSSGVVGALLLMLLLLFIVHCALSVSIVCKFVFVSSLGSNLRVGVRIRVGGKGDKRGRDSVC